MTRQDNKIFGPWEIEAELTGLLFGALRSGWSLGGSGSAVACYVAYMVRTPVAIGLAACVVAMTFVRAAVILGFPKTLVTPLSADDSRRWARRYGAAAIMVGLFTGLVNVEAISSAPSIAAVCFVWAAAAAFGCVSRTATVPWIARGFSLAVVLPTAAAALASPEHPVKAAGALLIAALPVAFQCANHLHETFHERIRIRCELAHRASHDDLTGLLNRGALAERMAAIVEKSGSSNQGFALLLLDMDGFKGVNDLHGHVVGDALLCEVARRLKRRLGPDDVAARIGGDEFAIVLNGVVRDAAVGEVARRLLDILAQPYQMEDAVIDTVSASIGFACAPSDGEALETLMKAADSALYRAKDAGRARCVRAQPPELRAA